MTEHLRRLLHIFRRSRYDRELEEEMRFHLEMRALESGAPAARRRFGSVALAQEDSRAAWGWTAVEQWLADLKYAARALRRNSGFTAVAVLTMALGIGATTAIFSVVYAVLLRPLPFHDPGRIMTVWTKWDRSPDKRSVVSYPLYRDWQDHAPSFAGMAVYGNNGVRTTVNGEPAILDAGSVSREFFQVMGVQPILGRTFTADEERTSAPPVTLLSYAQWQRLGADPAICGKTVAFDRETFTVIGVMPRGFTFPFDSVAWFPFHADDSYTREGNYSFRVIARLKDGASVVQAQTEASTIAARHWTGLAGAWVVGLRDQIVGDARPALLVLLGAVACVLLIACANLAGLLLARVAARRRELALRLSLGATRWRVARCVLSESVLLAVGGAAIGVAAAHALVRAFVALDPIGLPRISEVAVSRGVLLSALAAALATGIVFGLGPALRASSLREFTTNRARAVLASAQIALAVTLLIGAGLLLRSFLMRVSVPLGFRPEGVLGVELPWAVNPRLDEILDRLRAIPGVQSAGAATAFPQDHAASYCDDCLEIEGISKGSRPPRNVGHMVATPEFFTSAGLTLLRGRFFTAADAPESPKVAILSEALVRRDFEGRDPVGSRVKWGTRGDWATVIGVVGNVKGFGVVGDPIPPVYFPRGQDQWGNGVQVLVRTAVPPASLVAAVKKEIRSWNPRLILKIDTVENMLAAQVAVPRFYLSLLAGFAVLALLVAAVGVYGTVNYAVARRTHEIGIRMALGAERRDILAIVFRQGLAMTAAGLLLGLAGAAIATRALESLLFGVRPTDPAAFALGAVALVVAVLLACYFPARRAAKVDPLVALRHD